MAESKTLVPGEMVVFLRKRDYVFLKQLGQGACGQTVLVHDDQIDESFVCKKYVPYSETKRQELFASFLREIKLLHKIQHDNLVRVFNYFVFPEKHTGFVLMEYVKGQDVDDYLKGAPEQTNEVFVQAISGFAYLQKNNILHRDIRPANLMVRDDGTVKIIDLGFGKHIQNSEDFTKSISLNWWCEVPNEFSQSRYDFSTEVYFVGKLFEQIIRDNEINHFKYVETLQRMCQRNPADRIASFIEIEQKIQSDQFFAIDFEEEEFTAYRQFADALFAHITKIEAGAKYADDIKRIQAQLNDEFRKFMLEENVPNAATVCRLFVLGTYYLRKDGFPVWIVREFLHLLKSSSEEKKRIILANLHTKLDAIPRFTQNADEIPF